MVNKIFCDRCSKELKQKEIIIDPNDFRKIVTAVYKINITQWNTKFKTHSGYIKDLCKKCYEKINGELKNGN